jgi:hypothetical protein
LSRKCVYAATHMLCTTQTVSGQVKDIGTVLLGYIAFPPDAVRFFVVVLLCMGIIKRLTTATAFAQLNLFNIFGVTLGFVGSLSYAYVKYDETVNKNKK